MSESCKNFEPTEEMIQRFNEKIYANVEAVYGDNPDDATKT